MVQARSKTIELFLLPWEDGRQSPHPLPWQRQRQYIQGLFTPWTLPSSACDSATKCYEWLPATGHETHLYVNMNAARTSQYTNNAHGKVLNTAFISVPVSGQVNKEILITHLFPARCISRGESFRQPLVATFLLMLEFPHYLYKSRDTLSIKVVVQLGFFSQLILFRL